jgi:hypothetical protein
MTRTNAVSTVLMAMLVLLAACGGSGEPELLDPEDTPPPPCFTEGFPLTSTSIDVRDLSRTVTDIDVTLDEAPADICGWSFALNYDNVDTADYDLENPRVDEIEGGLLIRWLPTDCPTTVDLDITGTASAPVIGITPEETETCPTGVAEAILTIATLRPVDPEAVTVRLLN